MVKRIEIDEPDAGEAARSISVEQVCFIIVKAREFSVKDVVTEPDPASNATDDRMVSVLEDHAEDPVRQELVGFIGALDQDEQIDLVAIAWLGRDGSSRGEWAGMRQEAARAWRPDTGHAARYLLGMPLLADFLEEGLAMLGEGCTDIV